MTVIDAFDFKIGEKVVYPSHGVGKITGKNTHEVSGAKFSAYEIFFEKDKMKLHVPITKAKITGLRSLSSRKQMDKAISILNTRARVGRGMWSRRAQEYEGKINSGKIDLIAEVVRDLHKNVDDPDRSYSERVIYESALFRLSSEMAAIHNVAHEKANDNIVTILKVKRNKAANQNIKAVEVVKDDAAFDSNNSTSKAA